jgi:hypothetical protein
VDAYPRESWLAAEPERLARERAAMAEVAAEMEWLDEPLGGWEGRAPMWPFPRPAPAGLDFLLDGGRLRLRVEYSPAFPMVEPRLVPVDPEPPAFHRTDHRWHLNGDGSLCLLQTADTWSGRETAADLLVKASGWFIEYLLLERGLIEGMTENGIYTDDSLDGLIAGLVQ